MRLRYEVTEEIYTQAVRYQMELHNSRPLQQVRYWGLNVVFTAGAVYFFLARSDYAMWLRLLPLLMAFLLVGFSTWNRVNLPARARSAVRRYIKTGILEKDFIGEHTLVVEHGKIRLKAGQNWKEVPAKSFALLANAGSAVLMLANGGIFDEIPADVLQKGDTRDELLSAIEREAR